MKSNNKIDRWAIYWSYPINDRVHRGWKLIHQLTMNWSSKIRWKIFLERFCLTDKFDEREREKGKYDSWWHIFYFVVLIVLFDKEQWKSPTSSRVLSFHLDFVQKNQWKRFVKEYFLEEDLSHAKKWILLFSSIHFEMKRIEKIGLKSFSLARAYVEDLCENETLVKWKPSNRSVLDCSIPSKQKTANMVFNCLWINEFKSFSPTFSMST